MEKERSRHFFAQPLIKIVLPLPDTGKTIIYKNTTGEEEDYTINSPFSVNGNSPATLYALKPEVALNRGRRNNTD